MKLRSRLRRLPCAGALLAVTALAVSGCTATGGGTLPSQTGAKKATFGFTMKAEGGQYSSDWTAQLKGALSDGYVKFQVDDLNLFSVDGGTDGPCANGTWLYGSGTYVSQNKNYRGSGDIDIAFCDAGQPGATPGDGLYVVLDDGPFDGYQNIGALTGGNLQVKLS